MRKHAKTIASWLIILAFIFFGLALIAANIEIFQMIPFLFALVGILCCISGMGVLLFIYSRNLLKKIKQDESILNIQNTEYSSLESKHLNVVTESNPEKTTSNIDSELEDYMTENKFYEGMSKLTNSALEDVLKQRNDLLMPAEIVEAAENEISHRKSIKENISAFSNEQILKLLGSKQNYLPEFLIAEEEAKKRNLKIGQGAEVNGNEFKGEKDYIELLEKLELKQSTKEKIKSLIDFIVQSITQEQIMLCFFINWDIKTKVEKKNNLGAIAAGGALFGIAGAMIANSVFPEYENVSSNGYLGILIVTKENILIRYYWSDIFFDGRISCDHLKEFAFKISQQKIMSRIFKIRSNQVYLKRSNQVYLNTIRSSSGSIFEFNESKVYIDEAIPYVDESESYNFSTSLLLPKLCEEIISKMYRSEKTETCPACNAIVFENSVLCFNCGLRLS